MATTFTVTFDVTVADGIGADDKQAVDWIRYELGDRCELALANPLSEYELVPNAGTLVVRKV